MADHPSRKLAVILHADVVGSTELVQRDESIAHERIQASFRRFSETIRAYGGITREIRGDALVAEFARASDAVTAALSFQMKNTVANAQLEDDIQPELRIGISLGEVIVADNTVTGAGIVLAQRLEQLAAPGGVVVQGSVSETVPRRLPFDFDSLGEQAVKGFDQPVRPFVVQLKPGAQIPDSESKAVTPQAGTDDPRHRPPLELPDKPSIAVLPFTNMSGDAEQEYFSDGITEDIITELSRFSSLFVIARNSTFTYKGQSVEVTQVAQELGVRYVLEGSIRRAGKRVRITTQLIDSVTGNHIWAERYDGELEDIFELQDEITRDVVGSIAPQIELAEMERSRKLSDANLTAYELALKGQALFYDGVLAANPKTLVRAESEVDTALTLNPRNVHALWTKSLIYLYRHVFRWGEDPDAALATSDGLTERLIQIDSSDAKAYMIRAWSNMYRRQFDAALTDHRRALELNPNLASNLFAMAWSEAIAGLVDEAREHARLALRLSPRDADIWRGEGYSALALASFYEGDFAETVKWGHLANQMQPVIQGLMVAANAYLDDLESAKSHAEALEAFAPDFLPAVLSGKIEICKLPEHNKLFVEGLRRAGL